MTGATSFTGCHIARQLIESGHNVTGTLTKDLPYYSKCSPENMRVRHSKILNWIPSAPLGSDEFLTALNQGSYEVWMNHGAPISGYRNPDFDYLSSIAGSLKGMRESIALFKKQGGTHFVHSGSSFEPGEGENDSNSSGSSIYGVSKKMIWEAIRFFAEGASLRLTKVIIPNPIGPLENPDRMGPSFFSQWKSGKSPRLWAPQLIRDQLPATWLARVYQQLIETEKSGTQVIRPSGWIETNQEFCTRFLDEVKKRLPEAKAWRIDFQPKPTLDPHSRVNNETVSFTPVDENQFWDLYIGHLASSILKS